MKRVEVIGSRRIGDGAAALLHKPSDQTVVLVKQFRLPSYTAGHGFETPLGPFRASGKS
jgi:hypothetical protein